MGGGRSSGEDFIEAVEAQQAFQTCSNQAKEVSEDFVTWSIVQAISPFATSAPTLDRKAARDSTWRASDAFTDASVSPRTPKAGGAGEEGPYEGCPQAS